MGSVNAMSRKEDDVITPVVHALRRQQNKGVGDMQIGDYIALRYKRAIAVIAVDPAYVCAGTRRMAAAEIHLFETEWESLPELTKHVRQLEREYADSPMSEEFYRHSVELSAEFRHVLAKASASCSFAGWEDELALDIVSIVDLYDSHLPTK